MDDKEFLDLHKNITGYARGEQPVFPEPSSPELPKLEDVEGYQPAPETEKKVYTDVDKAVDKNIDTDKILNDTFNKEMGEEPEDVDLNYHPFEGKTVIQQIDESDTAKAFRRSNAYKTYMYNNEDVIAEARKISQATKISENVILSSPEALNNMRDVYKVYEKEKDMEKVYERYPGLKGLAEKDESAAALAICNLEDVKVAHGIVDNVATGGKKYWLGYQKNMIGAKGFYGEGITAEDKAKIKELDKQMKEAKEVPDFFDAPIDNALGTTSEQVAMMANQYARGGYMGLVGAGLGYLGTKLIGGAAGTVTGAGPLAMMATEQLARRNAMRGMSIGMRIGGGKAMFDELAGQYYLEALEYKNKAGGQQFTEDEARTLAALQAGIETMIELGTTESVLKILGKNPSTAPAKEILENLLKGAKDRESAIALLKTEGANLIRKTIKVGKEETFEEGKQQLATDLIGNVFAAYVAPDGHEKYGLNVLGPKELASRATDATLQAAVPSFTMGLAGAGASTVHSVRSFVGEMQLKEALNEVGLDYNNWKKNTNGVQMLRDLKEKFAGTKFAKEHPQEAEELLKETLKNTGYEEVVVDTELVKKEEGGSEILYQLASAAGMTEEQAQAAIENNENITVPTEVYAKSVMDNPIADNLLDKISFDKEGDCLERCRKYAASMKHAWDKMIDAESMRKAEAAYNVLKDVVGEENVLGAMGIVELYPQDPAAGAKKKAQEQQQKIDALLKPVLDDMNKNLDKWKQNYEKVYGHTPTQAEMRQIAEDVLAGKNEYGIPGWEFNDVEAEETAEANARILAGLKSDMAMYDNLSEKLKDYDAGKVAAAEGLSESGYEAYKYLVDAINGAEMNKATQRSVAAGAMLWAHVAERYAEAYQAMGQNVTALDVMKRFRFNSKEQGGDGQLNQQRDPYLRSRQENQNAIKDYYSGLEKLEDLAPEDISEAAEKVRFQNAEETRQECESFYQQIVNDGVEDPLGHKVTFVPTLHGKKVSIQEYVGFFIEKRIANSSTVSYTKAVAFKNIADTISNPDAIIKGNDGKLQYVKIYEKNKGGILNKTVVTVDSEGNNQFYTMHMNNTKNKKSTLNEMKKVIQNADEILYIRGRQTGHPLHPTDQHASLTDANLHMSGTFILPQFYDSVNRYENVLTENEKRLLSDSKVQKELQEVREKYKGLELGSKEGLAPDGTESTLTETQWLLARTEAFKKMFGDWELAYRQKALASQSNPITVKKGVLLKASQIDMGKKAAELIGELPKDVMTENGNVRISKEGLSATFIHGLQDKDDISRVTNIKGDAILSLEEGLKKSVFLDRIKDFKRDDAWDDFYAYWIEYDGEKMLVVCRVIDQRTEDDIKKGYTDVNRFEDNKNKRYLYVHEVYDSATLDKIKGISYEEANAAIESKVKKEASGNDMLQYVLARFINKDSNLKVDVLENGEPDLSKLDSAGNESKTYHQNAGAFAATANQEMLNKAYDLDEQGVDMDDIYNQTGWFKGEDGLWRFEIPDDLDAINLDSTKLKEGCTLKDVYDNPALFEAYPQLAEVGVFSANLDNNTYGQVRTSSMGDIIIEINRAILEGESDYDKEHLRETLVHEIQHVIQRYEGFAIGGNAQAVNDMIERQYEQNDNELKRIIRAHGDDMDLYHDIMSDAPEIQEKIKKLNEDISDIENNWDATEEDENDKWLYNIELKDYEKAIDKLQKKWITEYGLNNEDVARVMWLIQQKADLEFVQDRVLNGELSAFDAYQALYGEAEARNTARRADYHRNQLRRERNKEKAKQYMEEHPEAKALYKKLSNADYPNAFAVHIAAHALSNSESFGGDVLAKTEEKGAAAFTAEQMEMLAVQNAVSDMLIDEVGKKTGLISSSAKLNPFATIEYGESDTPIIVFGGKAYPQSQKTNLASNVDSNGISNPNIFMQRAWHGTSAVFDNWDLGFAGTGEGGAAHGWGLYFAQDKNVAIGYRRMLVGNIEYLYKGKPLQSLYDQLERKGDYDKLAIIEEFMINQNTDNILNNQDYYDPKAVKWFKDKVMPFLHGDKESGSLFEVNVPENDVLLDEQKSFEQQPDKVKSSINKLITKLSEAEKNAVKAVYIDNHIRKENTSELRYKLLEEKTEAERMARRFMAVGKEPPQKPLALNAYNKRLAELTAAGYDVEKLKQDDAERARLQKEQEDKIAEIDKKLAEEEIEREQKYQAEKSDANNKSLNELLEDMTGWDIYAGLCIALKENAKAASLMLNEYGIKGVTYDGQQDGRCFVVFDEKAVSTIERYNQASGQNTNAVNNPRPQGQIEILSNGQYVVHLLETADESTFMHEMSHGFFNMLEQMAQSENAPEQLKKDYETLRKWAEYNPDQVNEYKGTATYQEFVELDRLIREAAEKGSAKVIDANGNEHTESYASLLNRWQQERFARGFEEYLRQGKAPTEGMRGIFSKFKNWLVKIYKGCVGVGAKPSEAVKAVMDRMIASQEEIDLAMKRAEILKWKEAGAEELLTKTSQEYYDNLLTKAREEAEAKVLKLAMKDLDAEEKAKYQAKLDKEREAATERIKQKPVFVIQQHLEQNPGLDVESVAKLLGNMTEDEYKQQLKQEGGSVAKAVDRYMQAYQKELDDSVKPGGEQYQAKLRAAAEEAIVTSKYTDLIAAYELQTYKKAVQRIRRLEKRLANIEAKDEAEREAAEASIRREEKARNEQEDRDTRVQDLRKELKDMKESIRAYGKNSQDEISQARYYASNRLDTLPVGEATDYRKWGNLAVRKHQDAMDMLNAGKLEEATKLQKEVLVYRMLEKRAYELNQKYEKKITRMAARSRTIAREHSMNANDTYLYNHLLYLFGLAEKDAPKPADFPGVQQQLTLTSDGIVDDNVPESSWINPNDWLLNAITGEVPLKGGLDGLTMEQFREVEELMQYVYCAGKDRNSVKTLTDEEGNHTTIEDLNLAIALEVDKKRSLRDTRKNVGQDSMLETCMRAARKYKVELIKPETILQAMGESAMKYLYNPLRKCADNELRMNQELVEKQSALFAQYREDVIQSMGEKEGEKFLKDFSTKQQYVLGGMTRFKDSKLTHEELICLALNLGTEIGLKRVLDIYEMKEGKLRDLMYNLSGADWNLIQNIWNLHEEYWPALQKVTANVTGVTMEKQEARKFTMMSKDGVSYPLNGGYYHLAYDPTKNLKINEQKADERLTTQSGSNRRFGLGIGMTKERNQFEVKYALKLDLGVMQRALAETVHYICFYETVKDINRFINTYEFAETVVSYFGEEHYQTLQKWVKDAWALEPESKTAVEQFNAAMRANQTMATLGFSMITAAENILNIAPMMAEIGPMNALKAVASYYGQMFRTGLTNPMEMFDQNAFIAEHSIFMAERGESIDPNIHKAQADNGMNADNIISKGFKNTRDAAFYFITQTDLMLGRPLWMHEYQRVYNECISQNMSPEAAERKAVQAGDAAVRHVFGSAADVDKADIQKKNSELVKFATMFYSYFSTVHNAMVAKGYEYQEQRHKGANIFKAAAPTLAWGAMMWYLIPAIGSAVMRTYLKGGDDDQEPEALAKKIASTLVSNIFGGLPFARDVVPMAFDTVMGERTYGFRNAPMYEAGKQALTTVSTIVKAVQGDKDVFDVMRSLARVSVYMSRFPLTATNAMITAAQWITDSNVSDEEMAEYLRAMIMNQKPKK